MIKSMMMALVAAVCLFFSPLGECRAASMAAPEPIIVVKSDGESNAEMSVDKNATIQLRLPENPSTGYSWNFQVLDTDYLELIGDEFFYPQNDQQMVGKPGLRVFTLRAVDSGQTMIKLAYWRPWEGLKSRTDKFVIQLAIKTEETAQGVE